MRPPLPQSAAAPMRARGSGKRTRPRAYPMRLPQIALGTVLQLGGGSGQAQVILDLWP
jgi:hypothetical protein